MRKFFVINGNLHLGTKCIILHDVITFSRGYTLYIYKPTQQCSRQNRYYLDRQDQPGQSLFISTRQGGHLTPQASRLYPHCNQVSTQVSNIGKQKITKNLCHKFGPAYSNLKNEVLKALQRNISVSDGTINTMKFILSILSCLIIFQFVLEFRVILVFSSKILSVLFVCKIPRQQFEKWSKDHSVVDPLLEYYEVNTKVHQPTTDRPSYGRVIFMSLHSQKQ